MAKSSNEIPFPKLKLLLNKLRKFSFRYPRAYRKQLSFRYSIIYVDNKHLRRSLVGTAVYQIL